MFISSDRLWIFKLNFEALIQVSTETFWHSCNEILKHLRIPQSLRRLHNICTLSEMIWSWSLHLEYSLINEVGLRFLQLGHLTFSKNIFWSVSWTLVQLFPTGLRNICYWYLLFVLFVWLDSQPTSTVSTFLKFEVRDGVTILLTSLPKLYYSVEIMYSKKLGWLVIETADCDFLYFLPTKSKSLVLWGWWANTFRNIARLLHMLVEITFCSIPSFLLSVTQVKTKASSKKMQLQEVIKKIKTQIKIFIHISTKIDNFSKSAIDMFML